VGDLTERPTNRKCEGYAGARKRNTEREDKDVKQERCEGGHKHRTLKTSGKVKN